MRINNNISAMNTYRQYSSNAVASSKSMEKLSSGSRINRAADDAAGLSISEKMRSQIRGLSQANRNAQDGISLLQTAEGALTEVSDMLTRLKELAVQVQNGTYSNDDKANIGAEMNALGKAITDIYKNTEFNGISVFGTQSSLKIDGKTADEVEAEFVASMGFDPTEADAGYFSVNSGTWQKGSLNSSKDGLESTTTITAPENAPSTITDGIYHVKSGKIYKVDTTDGSSDDLAGGFTAIADSYNDDALAASDPDNGAIISIVYGEDGGQGIEVTTATTTSISSLTEATANAKGSPLGVTVDLVEAAITEVNTTRAAYGAQQNQLEHASNNMATTKENLQAAESRVRDVDMAEEMMEYTKNNILLQAAQAMLAQANSQPQGVLQLLQ